MQTISLILIALIGLSCSTGAGVTNRGAAFLATIGDVRIGFRSVSAADVRVESRKEAASPQFMEALPVIAEKLVALGLLACGDLAAIPGLVKSCPVPLPPPGVVE